MPNAQDYDLWLKLSKKIKLQKIPVVLGAYIERKDNITNRYYLFKIKSLIKIAIRYKKNVSFFIFLIKFFRIIFSKQWFRLI